MNSLIIVLTVVKKHQSSLCENWKISVCFDCYHVKVGSWKHWKKILCAKYSTVLYTYSLIWSTFFFFCYFNKPFKLFYHYILKKKTTVKWLLVFFSLLCNLENLFHTLKKNYMFGNFLSTINNFNNCF